jgi:hypothetical protein
MADSTSEAQIHVILRQTDYTYDEAREKLLLYNNDVMAVIRAYLHKDLPAETSLEKPLSMNQQIYKEIRNFMDEPSK